MGDPDNVARLIAAGSALGTVANMAVAYATYRRKRPTLRWKAADVMIMDGRADSSAWEFGVEVTLENRGENPLVVSSVQVEQRWDRINRPLMQRLRKRRPDYRQAVSAPVGNNTGELPLELTPFQRKELHFPGGWVEAASTHDDWQWRVTLETAGRWLSTEWKAPLPPRDPCQCTECQPAGDRQLTFDDLPQ